MLSNTINHNEQSEELHQLERAQYNPTRLDWTNTSKAKFRARLSRKLILPYLDGQLAATRKLQSVRLATKTSTSPREPDHPTKTSPRSMGASSQIFKRAAPEERGRAITSILNNELEVLDVSRLRWTRDRLSLVGRCTNLIKCDVSGIGTTDSAVIALQSCLRLRHLNLGSSEVSAKTLAESLPAWRHLQILDLNSNPQMFDYPSHGSNFLRSKWEKYVGVGTRALRNVYGFLHRLRVLSVTDSKTMTKIYRKAEGREYKFEQAILKGMLNGHVRMFFGQFAVHGGEIVTQDEVRGLSNLLGLEEGVEKDFPMPFDDFAQRLVLCLKCGLYNDTCGKNNDWEKLAWRTVGINVNIVVDDSGGGGSGSNKVGNNSGNNGNNGNNGSDNTTTTTTNYNALIAQIPIDQGAVLLRSISKSRSLSELSLSNCVVRDFSLGGFLPPPTSISHNSTHVAKWHEYNSWVQTGRWTSVKLTEKDHKDIDRCRNRQKDLRDKVLEFKERLKIVTEEMKNVEKKINEHGKTKRLNKELDKVEKRFKNIQQRIIESNAKIEDLEDDVSNMGSIVNGEIRPIPGPRLLLDGLNLTGSCISNEGVAILAARCPSVTKFRICCVDDGKKLTNDIGEIMMRAWPRLNEIDFSGCSQIGDDCILQLLKLPEIRRLSLGRCDISEKSTNGIAEHCDSLISCDLTGCVLIESALNNICRGNPNLQTLRLDFVDIDDAFLNVLRRKYKNIKINSYRKIAYERPPPRVWKASEDGGKGKKKGKKGGKKKGKKKKKR